MERDANKSIDIVRKLSAGNFLGALVLLSFFVYPLAVFPPVLKIGQTVLFNLPHVISIPGDLTLGLLGVPVLLFFNWRCGRFFFLAVVVFSLMLLINLPWEPEYFDEFLILTGYVTIPIATAILLKAGCLSLYRISIFASGLWLLQVLLGFIALYRRMEPVGTPGNINWMAGLLLILSPWVIWFLVRTARSLMKNRLSIILAILVWFIPTAIILFHCHSRAAWLAICLLPLFFVVVRLHSIAYKIIFTLLLMFAGVSCLAAAYIWFPTSLLHVVERDVRVPLWTGTGVMIMKNPLGVGSGSYQEHFAPLRRVSSYQHRLYAADMTVHPHNEALNVGAQLGIPALLAFLVLISTIGRSANNPLEICARISGYFVVMASMFDMFLVQPPTSFLGLFILGLCYPIRVNSSQSEEETTASIVIIKTAFSGMAVACVAVVCYLDIRHDLYSRWGIIEENTAQHYIDLNRPGKSREHLNKAIKSFKESVVSFNSIIPFYRIARLSLSLTGKSDQAEAYLNRVAAIDPNFSHLNLLRGQLSLQRGNPAAAERYFTRECRFYPRSEAAWQNMYSFVTVTGAYVRSIAIDTLLGDIYRERARQNLGETKIAEHRKILGQALHAGDLPGAQQVAGKFLDRINHNFTDPLFPELTITQNWPTFFFNGGFNILDTSTMYLRYRLFQSLQKDLGPLPIPPEKLVSWYTQVIRAQDNESLTLPFGVWNSRTGSPLSMYLLFSMVCELNDIPSIICLDSAGRPLYSYLFENNASPGSPPSENDGEQERQNVGVRIYRVDLLGSDCEPIGQQEFSTVFRWIPGKTFAFYPVADYFLRNQILGLLTNKDLPFLPQKPPSRRLLELFSLTGNQPPLLSTLKNYCYDGTIRYQYDMVRQEPSGRENNLR